LLKTARGASNDDVVDYDRKKEIMERFRGLLYVHNSEAYEEKLREFLAVIEGVEVRVGRSD
jgi:hypothetical protein